MNQASDQLIDNVLHALCDIEAPTGLEQRVAQRVSARFAQAAEARNRNISPFTVATRPFASTGGSAPTSFFAGILNALKDPRILSMQARRYAFALVTVALLITVSLLSSPSHRKPSTLTRWNPLPASIEPQAPTQRTSPAPAAAKASNTAANNRVANEDVANEGVANIQVPRGFSLGSHNPNERGGVVTPPPTDPDTIALAETLAPSHPAPPMPLTQQERLLISATRQGQPIELAELEPLRQPALRAAAAARERANLRQYIHGLLGPLAAAESLNPTPPVDDPAATAFAPPSSK